jgi:flagellar hook-associated protein 1 FlgK
MSLPAALTFVEEIRAALQAEITRARAQRTLIRGLDAAGLLAYAQARGAANARLGELQAGLGHALGAAAATLGRKTLGLDDLRALPQGRALAEGLGEVRALASALHELDGLNRVLAERALSCVRGYLDAVVPRVSAYDRKGARSGDTSAGRGLSTASRMACTDAMADLLALLSRGASSLAAQQSATAVVSHNLQNVNTPGYARQRAELAATLPAEAQRNAWIGRGVDLATVSQARDRFLENQLPGAQAAKTRSSAESDALAAVSALDPDAAGGLGAALGGFYASLRALAQNPGDAGLRQATVGATRSLALAFNRTGQALADARTGLDAQLDGTLTEANRAAGDVAAYNKQIRLARAQGGEPNDLLDARQKAVDALAELTGGTPIPTGKGDVNIVLAGGLTLVNGDSAATLSTIPDSANGGHFAVRLAPSDGAPPAKLPLDRLGGTAGGLIDARDGALGKAAAALDTLAFDFGNAVNTVHAAGFALDGTTGQNLFSVAAAAPGAALTLAVDPTITADPGKLAASDAAGTGAGNAANLQLLVGTEATPLSSGLAAGATLGTITTGFGNSAARAKAVFEQDAGILDQLQAMRQSVSGVSIDEEMVNLTKYQRGYEAVLKVITTADEMLGTLMEIKS